MTRVRRKQAERSAETSKRILDSAERLFADKGYEGVSMRTIAAEAQVNLASIVYYFDSKEGVFLNVLKRHMQDIQEARYAAIKKIDEEPSLEGYIRAFIEPAFHIIMDPQLGGRNFARFLWRLPHQPQYLLDKLLPSYDEYYKDWEDRIKLFYPNISKGDLQWFLHVSRSLFFSTLGRLSMTVQLPDEEWVAGVSSERIVNRMIKVLIAALKASLED